MSASPPTVERRSGHDRRKGRLWLDSAQPGQHVATWTEQRMQFITRYLFAVIGIIYFSVALEPGPILASPMALNLLIAGYCVYNSVDFYLSHRGGDSGLRRRIHMWIDIGMVTACVANDPNGVPLSMLAYVLIIMGNGMRYGMAPFRESIVATFVFCGLALMLRHNLIGLATTGGEIFLAALSAFIVVYCYALMQRIDATQRELVKHSRYDSLTGLLNRRGLYESAELVMQLLSRGNHAVTVIFADMDRFKRVNDTLGHAAGDRVLKSVSRLLVKSVRNSDLVARYGGDEFVLILPEATAAQASRVTTTLQRQIRGLAREVGVAFGVSFGIREVAAGGTNIYDLLVEVDQEMYRAKHNGDPRPGVDDTPALTAEPCGETSPG